MSRTFGYYLKISTLVLVILLIYGATSFFGLKVGKRFKRKPALVKSSSYEIPLRDHKVGMVYDPEYLVRQAETAEKNGDWEQAWGYYHIMANIVSPPDIRGGYALYRAGVASFNLGKYERAMKELEAVVEFVPNFYALDEVLFQLARTYEKLGDFDKARRAYQVIILKYPNKAERAKSLMQNLPE